MSSFLYKGNCYAAATSVYTAMAADCPPVTSSGEILQCQANATGYSVKIGTGAVQSVSPGLEQCVPEVTDAASLGGLVVLALVSAFALKVLWRAF